MRFPPSNHLVAASPLPLHLGYLFVGIQHSPVCGCSAEMCNFGVLTGEDKCTSFYSTIFFLLAPWKKSYDKPRQHIKKKRDIALPTKFCLVKTMVFPAVMYGYESWTIKKLSTEELMILNCGVGEDS